MRTVDWSDEHGGWISIGQWWPTFLTRFERGFGPPSPREATTGHRFKLYVVLPDGREVPWSERRG